MADIAITSQPRIGADLSNSMDPIRALVELQTYRRHCIRSQSRADRSIESLIARALGYRIDLPEKERETLFDMAQKIRKKVESDLKSHSIDYADLGVPIAVANMIQTSYVSRVHWDRARDDVEADMMDIARTLPVWNWVSQISGIAELGLAVVIGETGDLSNYGGPARVWKRLGLATVDGYRQSFIPADITGDTRKEEWTRRGYNRERRAQVWAFVDDVMLRHQWRSDRDENGKDPRKTKKPVVTPAHSIGPYGKVYGDRKEWNLARGLGPKHADRDARRVMAKAFIRDLWCQWRNFNLTQVAAE